MVITKRKDIHGEWLEQQNPPVPFEEQLKFTDPWLDGWIKEYEIRLRKRKKRLVVSEDDRTKTLTKTSTQTHKYAMGTRCHYTEVNPLCKRLCHAQVKTLVKENYMLPRARVTAFT